MPLILGTNSIKDTGYDVANSLRFNDNDSAYLNKTFSSASNRKTWTFSTWIKRGNLNTTTSYQNILNAGNDNHNRDSFFFDDDTDDTFCWFGSYSSTTYGIRTSAVFRDTSAWYHVVIKADTTQSTASDRLKFYVNNELQSVSTFNNGYLPQNTDMYVNSTIPQFIGKTYTTSQYFDGYLAETVFVDGTALEPTSFGEFDEDSPTIWKPKDVSGLTFGNNGFYLDFENASNLGADVSGNSNNFNVNNLTSVDQSTDTCTNNFATMNPLDNYYAGATFSEGNLKIVTGGSNITYVTSTIGFDTGKWYMETKLAGSAGYTIGVVRGVATANDNSNKLGNRSDGWSYDDGGDVEHNGGSLTGSFASYSSGDIIGVYADLDNNKLYFSKNGTLQNSGTGLTLTAGTYFFAVGDNHASNSSTFEVNFGSPTFSISSGNTDGEYGNFEYSTTITGDGASKTFKALCTKNLAEYG